MCIRDRVGYLWTSPAPGRPGIRYCSVVGSQHDRHNDICKAEGTASRDVLCNMASLQWASWMNSLLFDKKAECKYANIRESAPHSHVGSSIALNIKLKTPLGDCSNE
eukprot:4870276-Amphidinium_carterae.1